jgi:AcrR family transcriptional regulator
MTFGTTTAHYGEVVSDPRRGSLTREESSTPPRGDDTRQALLAAAHDLLASEGPGSLTVRRIATAAGMSTMNVYSRFGGKDGVLDELFIDGFRRLEELMAESPETDDPREDLRQCRHLYRRFARENATYYSLMFDRVVPDFVPSERAEVIALDTLRQLQRQIERAMSAGVIRDGDSFAVATGLWALVHGLVSLEARTEGKLVDFDWQTVYDVTTEALIRGLA